MPCEQQRPRAEILPGEAGGGRVRIARKDDLERIRPSLGRAAAEKTAERDWRVERRGGDQTAPTRGRAPRRAGSMHGGHAGAWPRRGGERARETAGLEREAPVRLCGETKKKFTRLEFRRKKVCRNRQGMAWEPQKMAAGFFSFGGWGEARRGLCGGFWEGLGEGRVWRERGPRAARAGVR